VNRGELRDKLARMLDTSTASPRPWTTTQLDGIIRDAHETVVELVAPIERSVLIPLVGEKVWYRPRAYADDMIAVLRLSDPINENRLTAVVMDDLDRDRDRWEATTGQSQFWTVVGFDWIGIYPHAASDGGVLRLDYAAWPQDALGDSTPLEVDPEDEDRILELAMADCQAWNWDEDSALARLGGFARSVGVTRGRTVGRVGFQKRDERQVGEEWIN